MYIKFIYTLINIYFNLNADSRRHIDYSNRDTSLRSMGPHTLIHYGIAARSLMSTSPVHEYISLDVSIPVIHSHGFNEQNLRIYFTFFSVLLILLILLFFFSSWPLWIRIDRPSSSSRVNCTEDIRSVNLDWIIHRWISISIVQK